MHSPLILGSLAYDTVLSVIGVFGGQGDENAPAYIASEKRQLVGGCAGNIAYALRKLGDTPVIMATGGQDFDLYEKHLREHDIGVAHIKIIGDDHTAQAYIFNDERNRQMIFFHPGATAFADSQDLDDLETSPPLAIVSPNGKAGMIKQCRQLAARNIPFLFDPGQAMSLFSAEELGECFRLANMLIFNVEEARDAERKVGASLADWRAASDAVILTDGEAGSTVYAGDEEKRATAVRTGKVRDTTGCGDAYRAGVIHGLLRQWDWQATIDFASVIGGIKAAHHGGQGYGLSLSQAADIYRRHTGRALPA